MLRQAVGLSARTEQPATQPGGAPAVPSASVHAADNASIVRLDLDRDAVRQTVVDKEEGVYLGHVTTVRLDDGKTILAAYPKGHGKGPIVLRRSEDGQDVLGAAARARLVVHEQKGQTRRSSAWARTDAASRSSFSRGCTRWSPLARAMAGRRPGTDLAPIGDFGGIVAMGGLADLGDGKFAAFFHDDGRSSPKAARPPEPSRSTRPTRRTR